jgi:hypothetical protein
MTDLEYDFRKIYGKPPTFLELEQFRKHFNSVRCITEKDQEVILGRKKRTQRDFNHAGSN